MAEHAVKGRCGGLAAAKVYDRVAGPAGVIFFANSVVKNHDGLIVVA
jgi:hypothetical protein